MLYLCVRMKFEGRLCERTLGGKSGALRHPFWPKTPPTYAIQSAVQDFPTLGISIRQQLCSHVSPSHFGNLMQQGVCRDKCYCVDKPLMKHKMVCLARVGRTVDALCTSKGTSCASTALAIWGGQKG